MVLACFSYILVLHGVIFRKNVIFILWFSFIVTLTHVSERYPDTLLPTVTLTLCFPTRFLQNVVRSSARSRGINKKKLKYSYKFQSASKNRGKFCLTVGSAGLISVHYEKSLCSI